ncbi:hypothetical protein EYF80_007046 [Liparis tanakae]|uniref:Uncharacterized protein n=1 Tax=Liparis tanakae TaxID=230148 RepID=A0A4Z2IZ25_9TELE|nr:hypothetical protein EYF80_007046 [Liparis tanakae]
MTDRCDRASRMLNQTPMFWARSATGRRYSHVNLCASRRISTQLLRRAKSGARGNAATKMWRPSSGAPQAGKVRLETGAADPERQALATPRPDAAWTQCHQQDALLPDVVQWLVLVPFTPAGPVVVENLPLVQLIGADIVLRELEGALWAGKQQQQQQQKVLIGDGNGARAFSSDLISG